MGSEMEEVEGDLGKSGGRLPKKAQFWTCRVLWSAFISSLWHKMVPLPIYPPAVGEHKTWVLENTCLALPYSRDFHSVKPP